MDLLPLVDFLFSQYGLLGLFIASIVGNATILFPLPIDLFILGYGALAPNPLAVFVAGTVSGVGAAIGEMTGYILGYLGIKSLESIKKRGLVSLAEVRKRLRRGGIWIVFLGALTPFPFDIIGIAAGMIKYNPRHFFLAALGGKVVRYVLIAYAGFYGMQVIKSWFLLPPA